MFPQYLRKLLVGATIAIGAAMALGASAACSTEDAGQNADGYATETQACKECQGILVECTSTSRDESQFVACRDQWQSCQSGKGLDIGECKNPGDNDACSLCRARLTTCKAKQGATAKVCEEEFGICKAYLITRGDIQQRCTATSEVPPEVSCGVCQKDMATCVSDTTLANAMAVCSSKFEACGAANGLSAGQCAAPSGDKACTLCKDQHGGCVASGGPNCDPGFAQCKKNIAPAVSCELSSGGGGAGGEGGGGEGGGGGGSCSHDACVTGVALTDGCDGGTCVSQVCMQDDWCCTNDWDEFCVQKAEAIFECACTI